MLSKFAFFRSIETRSSEYFAFISESCPTSKFSSLIRSESFISRILIFFFMSSNTLRIFSFSINVLNGECMKDSTYFLVSYGRSSVLKCKNFSRGLLNRFRAILISDSVLSFRDIRSFISDSDASILFFSSDLIVLLRSEDFC